MNLHRDHIEREQTVRFWGQEYLITPRLVNEVLGDGQQIIGFAPLMTRPNYYVVRVDSGWNDDNWAQGDLLIDHIDDIYEAIEEEYGSARCGGCGETDGDESCEACHGAPGEFPELNDECGSEWFPLNKADVGEVI